MSQVLESHEKDDLSSTAIKQTPQEGIKAQSSDEESQHSKLAGEAGEINYESMSWPQGAVVMLAENISLGILSLPGVIGKVGLVGGIIAIVLLGIISTYSGYVLWQFKMKYPHINNYADIGEILFGRVGKEFFGVAYVIYCIFCMASHLLTFTIALNVLTKHATCTIVWGVVGLIVFWVLSLPRTLEKLSYLSIISFLSILSAVMLTMIALAVDPKAAADDMKAFYHPTFTAAFNSISNIVFAYGGHVAWISFISELKRPEDFPKALLLQQSMDLVLYTIAAIVIYRYAGEDVASPALNSNSATIRKIAWGIALPTIVIAGVIFAHVTAKYAFIRIFEGTKHYASRGWLAQGSWIALVFGMWFIAFVIAESIPIFSDLLGFISALFASWFSYGVPGVLWFYINWGNSFNGPKKIWLALCNIGLVVIGLVIFGAGLYASGTQIALNSGSGHSWSCANNADS